MDGSEKYDDFNENSLVGRGRGGGGGSDLCLGGRTCTCPCGGPQSCRGTLLWNFYHPHHVRGYVVVD